jgi:hypothetical protein
MEPKGESVSGGKIAAFIIGGILVVVFLALIFNNNSSPSTPNVQNAPSENQTSPPQVVENNNPQSSNPSQITASDIAPYLTGVYGVLCSRKDSNGVDQLYDTGSGSLWTFSDGSDDIVTNEHVIAGDDYCVIYNSNVGMFGLNLSAVKAWNQSADEAIIPVLELPSSKPLPPNYPLVNSLNYSISSLQDCPSNMPQDSPVIVVGYPAFSTILNTSNPEEAFKNQIVTNGTISGYDAPAQSQGLPDSNYYISATIDSGNSGGVAFSKNTSGLCLLGIPTWITLTGNFNNEGIVQNIFNIKYSQ